VCWGSGHDGWPPTFPVNATAPQEPPAAATTHGSPDVSGSQTTPGAYAARTGGHAPRSHAPLAPKAAAKVPASATVTDRDHILATAQQLVNDHATPWGAWSDSDGHQGYGVAVHSAALRIAEQLTPKPEPPRSWPELEQWEGARHRRSIWIYAAAGTALLSVLLLMQRNLPGPLGILAVGFYGLIAIGLFSLTIDATGSPRPRPPVDAERAAKVEQLAAAMTSAAQRLDERRRGAQDPSALRESVGGRWQPLAPRPTSVQTLTWREAEELCAGWLRWMGYPQVQVTQSSRDGGVDLTAKDVVAQVKFQAQPVSPNVIRALHGVAAVQGCHGIVFSSSGYTRAAKEFANAAGVSLVTYDPRTAAIQAHSEAAEALLGHGYRLIELDRAPR